MRCEVVAVGTELLLGHVVNTNSATIGTCLADAGIDCFVQTTVGDNEERIAGVLEEALRRADAVIVCGGLGPTQDDITREAIARVLGVPLVRDPDMAGAIRAIFAARGRPMAANNGRQADRPGGAEFIRQVRGTAPGLICPAPGGKVIYAVPGVPFEMEEMVARAVVPDLQRRAGTGSVIVSRLLRTWGVAESTLAEMVAPRVDTQTNPTIAFLAQGLDGINLRLTAKAADGVEAARLLDSEEAALRALLGDLVFGVDDQKMERVVGELLRAKGLTVGVGESLTGGLVGARLAEVAGSSAWFRGSIVAYASEIKFALLGVPEGPVVTAEAAQAMAEGARRALGADVGLGITGVAGPAEQEGRPVGTVFAAVAVGDRLDTTELHLPGDRQRVRQYATISLFDLLRRRLLAGE